MRYGELTLKQQKKARTMEFNWLLAEVMKKLVSDMRPLLDDAVKDICQKQEYEVIKGKNGTEEVVRKNDVILGLEREK